MLLHQRHVHSAPCQEQRGRRPRQSPAHNQHRSLHRILPIRCIAQYTVSRQDDVLSSPMSNELVWDRPEPPSKPSPTPLSRELIVTAAIRLADGGGLDE